jgi:hypothetical protein
MKARYAALRDEVPPSWETLNRIVASRGMGGQASGLCGAILEAEAVVSGFEDLASV